MTAPVRPFEHHDEAPSRLYARAGRWRATRRQPGRSLVVAARAFAGDGTRAGDALGARLDAYFT
jgi:hypothetical protein